MYVRGKLHVGGATLTWSFLRLATTDPDFTNQIYSFLSFQYSAPRLWNSLPVYARTATSMESFRSKLKGYYFSLAYPIQVPSLHAIFLC